MIQKKTRYTQFYFKWQQALVSFKTATFPISAYWKKNLKDTVNNNDDHHIVRLDNFYLLRLRWLLLQILRESLLASNFFCSDFTLFGSCLFSLWSLPQLALQPVLEERGFTGRVISKGSPSVTLSMDSSSSIDSTISAGCAESSCKEPGLPSAPLSSWCTSGSSATSALVEAKDSAPLFNPSLIVLQ